MNNVKRCIIILKIKWHWMFIKLGRIRGEALYDKTREAGEQLNTPKIMAWNQRMSRHSERVMQLTEKLKDM